MTNKAISRVCYTPVSGVLLASKPLSMPCNHKFPNELLLEQIDYEPVTLIVGTFNPEWPEEIPCEWFYGRTASNHFWNVLPRLYGEGSLADATADEWKAFCRSKQIAITDIISGIDDAERDNKEHNKIFTGLADQALAYNFDDLDFVNIVKILKDHPTIKNVYFTRGITEAFWRHLWNPVMQYCSKNDIHERRLLSPSADAASYHKVYNEQQPDNQIAAVEDYILMRWREEWHEV